MVTFSPQPLEHPTAYHARSLAVGCPAWLTLLLALGLISAQPALAIQVNLETVSSQTGTVSLANATSPVAPTGALSNLAQRLGIPPTGAGLINDVVRLTGGGLSATFASAAAPGFNTVTNTRTGFPPWESINDLVALTPPLSLVAQPVTAEGAQNTAIYGFDYTAHGLPGLQYFITGILNNQGGGVMSLGFDIGQTQFGFNIAGLDQDQPDPRLIFLNFYDAAGALVDELTVRVPVFTGPLGTIGTAVVAITSAVPFYGFTISTDDPGGFGTGDFRYVVPTPSPATIGLAIIGLCGMIAVRRRGVRAAQPT